MSALPPGLPAVVLDEIDNIVGRFASLVLDHQGGVFRGVMRPGTSMARKLCNPSGREVSKFVETGSGEGNAVGEERPTTDRGETTRD